MDYTELLPPLPPYLYGRECSENERVWSEEAVRAAQLAAIAAAAPAIRRAERGRIVAHADKRRAAESAAAAHHAGRWQPAFEAHTTRHAAMCDMLDAIRALPEEP